MKAPILARISLVWPFSTTSTSTGRSWAGDRATRRVPGARRAHLTSTVLTEEQADATLPNGRRVARLPRDRVPGSCVRAGHANGGATRPHGDGRFLDRSQPVVSGDPLVHGRAQRSEEQ